jgi:hypothetical protein
MQDKAPREPNAHAAANAAASAAPSSGGAPSRRRRRPQALDGHGGAVVCRSSRVRADAVPQEVAKRREQQPHGSLIVKGVAQCRTERSPRADPPRRPHRRPSDRASTAASAVCRRRLLLLLLLLLLRGASGGDSGIVVEGGERDRSAKGPREADCDPQQRVWVPRGVRGLSADEKQQLGEDASAYDGVEHRRDCLRL